MTITDLLHQEVVPAIGCTEPIAVALCVAKAKEELGQEPEEIVVRLSKNIYKNAMAVGIPNTGMTGLPIAIALGATAGHSAYMLEVLRDADDAAVTYAKGYMERIPIRIEVAEDAPDILYIHTLVRAGEAQAEATIQGTHTHFVENDPARPSGPPPTPPTKGEGEKSPSSIDTISSPSLCREGWGESFSPSLVGREGVGPLLPSLRAVWEYAMKVDLEEVEWLQEGAEMNIRAAETSFRGNYGHGLGRLLHSSTQAHLSNCQLSNCQIQSVFGDTLFTKILSYTCGACDARMSGAMVQVMSNSGSGNQGISCSVPVYLYAKERGCSREQTIRALTLSNLTVVYIKQSLGRLSALCGCVVAATGSAVGITYLMGGGYKEATYAVKNMIANLSGMICDGAKPGCALKVTSGVGTAILSASLAMQHSYADASEGIVEEDIDRTIHNLTRIGHDGMTQTDDLILDIMTHKKS
ncbi:MAG: L-serine ammonia-lyase, iron-sulfur-dependent, subunit alpha [Paludibacteraceae bacterium]|nr:L-serine ammonia-lyase, iron-sulfur-dependent, subunit alpha [Paludibacteraceae bacterium]